MTKQIAMFFVLLISLWGYGSQRVGSCCGKKCEKGTLYYLPNCTEIKGYVDFDTTRLQRVFQHELPESWRKDSVKVCIKYKNVGVGILMSDCLQSEIIKIKCIKGYQ